MAFAAIARFQAWLRCKHSQLLTLHVLLMQLVWLPLLLWWWRWSRVLLMKGRLTHSPITSPLGGRRWQC